MMTKRRCRRGGLGGLGAFPLGAPCAAHPVLGCRHGDRGVSRSGVCRALGMTAASSCRREAWRLPTARVDPRLGRARLTSSHAPASSSSLPRALTEFCARSGVSIQAKTSGAWLEVRVLRGVLEQLASLGVPTPHCDYAGPGSRALGMAGGSLAAVCGGSCTPEGALPSAILMGFIRNGTVVMPIAGQVARWA